MQRTESYELWDTAADEWARFADHNEYRLYQLIPATLDLVGEVRGWAFWTSDAVRAGMLVCSPNVGPM